MPIKQVLIGLGPFSQQSNARIEEAKRLLGKQLGDLLHSPSGLYGIATYIDETAGMICRKSLGTLQNGDILTEMIGYFAQLGFAVCVCDVPGLADLWNAKIAEHFGGDRELVEDITGGHADE